MHIGVDYASVDQNMAPSFTTFKTSCMASGSRASFVFFRIAWGTALDRTASRDWDRAIDAGLVCGGYLYLRLPHQGFTATPEDQVDAFAGNVKLTTRDFVPVLDIEDTGLEANEEIEWVHRAWIAMRSIYGAPPIIYDSGRVWTEDLHNLPAGEMVDSPQWVAKPWPWRVQTPACLSPLPFSAGSLDPIVPQPWGEGNWWIHQYQGDAHPVPGFSSTVDLSRFNLMMVGERGRRVAWARRRLGSPGEVFDYPTEQLVKDFQNAHDLAPDGVIGPKTFAALAWITHTD